MMPLSPYEQNLLAAIEKDLREKDPKLAEALVTSRPADLWQRLPLTGRDLAGLTAVLMTLIAAHTAAGDVHPVVTGALTAALVLAWLLMAVRGARARDRADPAARRAGATGKTTATCLAWIALAIVGAVIEGLFWLTIVGVVVLLAMAVAAAIRRHQAAGVSSRASPHA